MAKKISPGLAEQLRQAIKTSGMSLNQLQKETGVGRDRLSRFVREERDLTVYAAEQICRVLKLTLAEEK